MHSSKHKEEIFIAVRYLSYKPTFFFQLTKNIFLKYNLSKILSRVILCKVDEKNSIEVTIQKNFNVNHNIKDLTNDILNHKYKLNKFIQNGNIFIASLKCRYLSELLNIDHTCRINKTLLSENNFQIIDSDNILKIIIKNLNLNIIKKL